VAQTIEINLIDDLWWINKNVFLSLRWVRRLLAFCYFVYGQ